MAQLALAALQSNPAAKHLLYLSSICRRAWLYHTQPRAVPTSQTAKPRPRDKEKFSHSMVQRQNSLVAKPLAPKSLGPSHVILVKSFTSISVF